MPIYNRGVACKFAPEFSRLYNTLYDSLAARDRRPTDSGACTRWIRVLIYNFGIARGRSLQKCGLRSFPVKVWVICSPHDDVYDITIVKSKKNIEVPTCGYFFPFFIG